MLSCLKMAVTWTLTVTPAAWKGGPAMTKYAVHIAFGLGLAIMLGGCGLLLNVAPAGGTPLNQPSSYRAPTLTAVPTTVVPTVTMVAPTPVEFHCKYWMLYDKCIDLSTDNSIR
jgi:hypothetical protein